MKKAIVWMVALLLAVSLTACGCNREEGEKPTERDVKSYEQLYDGNAKTKYVLDDDTVRFRGSYGWTDNTVQGYNNFYYLAGDSLQQMDYDAEKCVFSAGGATIGNGIVSPAGTKAALRFVSPKTGSAAVSGTVRMHAAGETGATLTVLLNGTQIYPASGAVLVDKDDATGWYFSFDCSLRQGDNLDFVLRGGGEIYCNPTIDYSGQLNDTLYRTTEWGYYGDVHEYYHNDTVNLYHLRNLGPDNWEWYLDTTKDMFRYERSKTYDTSFVENHYMAYSAIGDLVDYDYYPDGGRDCTLFYDEQASLYRYIGLTYKSRTGKVNCDLSMRTSKTNDIYGDWEHAAPLRTFPDNSGEPECAAFRNVDGAWYLYAGISGQSVHGVGGLSYWMGEKGARIDETDWQSAQTYRLDGEDLAVPQIEEVGGRWYMYGWMPRNYAGNEWGGYLNLPREVYRRENGLLGTRLDPMATKLVNRGKMLSANESNVRAVTGTVRVDGNSVTMTGGENVADLAGTYDSSFVTFNLKMDSASEAGYVLNSGGAQYRVMIVKRADGTYMQIGSPSDPRHKVSSELYLGDAGMDTFDVKIAVEGGIIEMYVNDTLTLSGRTALALGAKYTPSLYAKGGARFNDVTINRMAQYYDIYD